MSNFAVKFQEVSTKFAVNFQEASDKFTAGFKELSILPSAPAYLGPYEITPMVDLQTVPTAQKFMTKDMTINAIPYFDVGNTAGGSTVYIGSEV